MEITVNQTSYSLPETYSLQQMLNTVLGQPVTGMAIAVNQEIITKTSWDNYSLQPGDSITIIKATQGG
ncbi:MAG TPA: sulfur carrier protein ThiS [Mucilaginibacter sp.]|jgi:sulfur carrier protein